MIDEGIAGNAGAQLPCNCPESKGCLAYIESEGGVSAAPCMLNNFHMICAQEAPRRYPCPKDGGTSTETIRQIECLLYQKIILYDMLYLHIFY